MSGSRAPGLATWRGAGRACALAIAASLAGSTARAQGAPPPAGSAPVPPAAGSAGPAVIDVPADVKSPAPPAAGSAGPVVIDVPADVQAPEVLAAASPSVVRLGDPLTLFVTATHAPDVEVNLREPLELGEAFEVGRKVATSRTHPDGRRVREWQIEVRAWDVGDLQLPPLAVTFTSHGRAGQVATRAVPVRVTGILGDLVDDPGLVRGHAPPVSLTSRTGAWAWLAAGVVALLGIVLAARRLRRRSRRRALSGGITRLGVPVPARLDMTSERALERLREIDESGALDRDLERKAGYAALVGVVREYVGGRFRVATLDLTSAELLRALAGAGVAGEHRARIASWLERCDRVKYGGIHATVADAHDALDGARAIVVATSGLLAAATSGEGSPGARPEPEAHA